MKTIKAGSLRGHIFFWLAITTSIFPAHAQTAQTNLAVTVRHAPSLNGGTIQGSLQQINGENVTANGGFAMTGDLLVPGTPTLRLNGNPTYSGVAVGSGSFSPSGYQVTLNGNCSLHYLRTQTTPVSLPTVSAPPSPTGTRSVNINSAGQSYGDATTLRDLTLNGNVGMIAVPPGTYGNITVNGGSGLVLGVAGGLQAVNYNLQNMNLNGNSTLKIVGPVVLTVANGFTANGTVGSSNNPTWLQLKVASGGFTLNGGCIVYGLVLAPNGTVIINGNSTLVGTSASDQFILNGGGLVRWGGSATQTNQPPVATAKSITLAENSSTNLTLTGTDPQGGTLSFTLLTTPTHGTLTGTPPSVTYKPATNYFGNDAFTFKVNNGFTDSSPATISLTVTQVYYAPTAIAQSLTNFEDTALPVTLTGYDPQGYALTFSVLTQPTHGTLSGTVPNLTYQPATNYFGNDSFTFRVNDGVSNSPAATINITNQPVDDPPVVVAGPNQLIILPTNFVYLSGSVSYDIFPGTVDTVVWSKVSGLGSVTFSNPSNILTTATFSTNGIYRLRLFGSDSFLSGSNDLWVTVDAPPVVSAGQTMTNTFPGIVILPGLASDDGLPTNGTLKVVWSKVSGAGTVVFENPAATNSAATFSTNGVYVLRLIADDSIATNHADVTVIENLPPEVNAGANILTNGLHATLKGIVTDDNLPGAFLSTQWSQSTGPGTVTFGNASATNTTVTASQSGTYVLALTAFDGAATNSSEVTITFNLPPVVNAGPGQTVNFGEVVTLAGTVTDDQLPHNILNSTWSGVSGPGNATFADAGLTNTTVTFDQPGIYTLRLTASDTLATTNSDVVIRVNAAPVVNAGSNQLVTLGTQVTLAGSQTDDGIPGSTVTTLWTQTSGPAGAVFADPTATSTTVSFGQGGVYVFQLTADDGMTNGSAQVAITVDQAPLVTAAARVLINWPANQTILNGVVTDDGLPAGGTLTSIWSQINGASPVAFSSPISTRALNGVAIITQPSTTATFATPGLYLLRIAGDDGQATNHSDVVVTVNTAPVACAGTNPIVAWPTNQVVLQGTATDDGLPAGITTTVWSVVSGPGTVTFDDSSATNTTATFSQPGVYVLRLTASDSAASSSSDLTVVLDTAPVVNAGTNQIVTGTNQVQLLASVAEDGLPLGTLTSTWSVVSGPGTVHFQPAIQTNSLTGVAETNEFSTTASFSQPGVYVLGLTADDSVATNMAEVVITLNQAPEVDAGPAQTVQAGQGASLQGFVLDDGLPEGGALTIGWRVISGPGLVMIDDPGSPETVAHFSTAGTYVLRLVATDGLATNSSDTTITVVTANQPPIVRVGPKKIVVLPAVANLNGSVSDDGLPQGSSLTTVWSKVSGPGAVTFSNPASVLTTASFNEPGDYILRLTANDTVLASHADLPVAVRTPAMNQPPVVNAGPNKVIGLTNVVTLDGSFTDDGLPLGVAVTVNWSVLSGPGTVTFEDAAVTNARVTFGSVGAYHLRLTANDSQAAASNDVMVTVYPFNQPPVVDAGSNQTIVVPDPDALTANGLLPANPSVELGLSLLSTPHWNNAIGQPGLKQDGAYRFEPGTYPTVIRLSWSGTRLVASGTFVASGTNFIGSVAAWNGTNWSGLFDNGLLYPGGPPFGNPSWNGEDGYAANDSAVMESTSRGNEVFINGGFLSARHPDAGQETLRWDGTGWQTWGVEGTLPYYTPRQMLATSNMVYELFDLFKPTYVRSYNAAAWGEVWADTNWNNYLATNVYTPDVDLMPTYEGVATWDGTNWGHLGDLMQIYQEGGWISSIAAGNHGEVYIAGEFYLDTPNGVANGIAMWNGTNWCALGAGITGRQAYSDIWGQLQYDHLWINGMAVDYAGNLYVVGEFSQAGGKTVNGIAKWDGNEWSALGNGIGWNGESVAAYGRDIYVSGRGLYADGLPPSQVLRWDGHVWSVLPQGSIPASGYVATLASGPNGVFMAGQFSSAGGDPVNSVAFWEYPSLPSNCAYLNGRVSDDGLPMGSTLSAVWTKQSGPGDVIFANATNPVTTATFSKAGTYLLRLSATDGEYTTTDDTTVIVHGNEPPTADAGTNQVVDLGSGALLSGTVSDDGLPVNVPLSKLWTVVNGPGTVTFDNPASPQTTAHFSSVGTYVLRLSANDSQFTASADITIQVLPQNNPPSVTAGVWISSWGWGWLSDSYTVYLPDSVALSGSVQDDMLPQGVLTHTWSQVSGPAPVLFSDASAMNTSAIFTEPGTYVVRLSASDSELSGSSDVTIYANQTDPFGSLPYPWVWAGADQRVQLTDNVPLQGVVNYAGDSTNLTVSWHAAGGPGEVTFGDASAAVTTATFSAPGIYELVLQAYDGRWWSPVSDHVLVTVDPPTGVNRPPVVKAGPARTGLNGVSLALLGSVSDDGLPAGASLTTTWSQLQGPATVVFADNTLPATSVTCAVPGDYILQLVASDSELSTTDSVCIHIVDCEPQNLPPAVNAGADQITDMNGDNALLSGAVSDDGKPSRQLNSSWTQVAGPVSLQSGYDYWPDFAFQLPLPGWYVFRLTADDGSLANADDIVIVRPTPTNKVTVVDAGAPQTLLLPTNSITLTGRILDSGLLLSSNVNYHWEVTDAPGPVVFDDTNSLTPMVTFPDAPIDYGWGAVAGYTLSLVLSNGESSTSSSVRIVVGDPLLGHQPIEVDAGTDQTISVNEAANLSGQFSVYPDSTEWVVVDGPGVAWLKPAGGGGGGSTSSTVAALASSLVSAKSASFASSLNYSAGNMEARFSTPGTYRLRLNAYNWYVGNGSGEVVITVLGGDTNQPPLVDAGPSRTLALPENHLTLEGWIAGSDGNTEVTHLTSLWEVVNSPAGGVVTFGDSQQAKTAANFNLPGSYVLRLTTTDGQQTNSSETTINIIDPGCVRNAPPVVDAGSDATVTFPDSCTLSGTVTDDGFPGFLSSSWSLVSQPFQSGETGDNASIASPDQTTTTVSFRIAGTYVFRLTANDGSLTNAADVTVTVLPAANFAPVVHAGFQQTVYRGETNQLAGVVLDDGLPVGGALTAHWSVVSGPGTAAIADPSATNSTVTFDTVGAYVLRLTGSDSVSSASSDVTYIVTDTAHGNQPPLVSAGPGAATITRVPLVLQGTVQDDGLPANGHLVSFWTQVSGPAAARFASATQTNTAVTFYQAGTYVLSLVANDGQMSAAAQVSIVVTDPTNQPPAVYAGGEQTVTRPAAAVLEGLVIDDDLPSGYPLTYQWTKVSGPGTVRFATDTSTNAEATPWLEVNLFDAFASATFSANGTYILRLSASDTQFTNTDEVTITVLSGVNTPPVVDAGSNQTLALPAAALLHTGVTDDGLPGGTLEISWSQVSGPGPVSFSTVNGIYRASFVMPGSYELRLTASDGELSSSNDVTITVYGVTPAPIAEINLPLDGGIITSPTNIIGTASSPMLQGYELQYRLQTPDGTNGWSVFAAGSTSVVSNSLGVLDPTLALNGIYEVRLVAADSAGRLTATAPITVIFDRNLKIGNFTLSFNDLSVPVAGLPLQVTRTYDSRAAASGVQGDFGAGWTMDLRNVRLQKNRSLSRNWVETTTGSADDLSLVYHLDPGSPRIVTITFPDGRVEKFQFTPNPMDSWLWPIEYPQWNFTPMGNTHGTLVPATYDEPEGNFLMFFGSIPGSANLYDLNHFLDAFSAQTTTEEFLRDVWSYPTLFRYTSAEGYQYLIDEKAGLQSVTDPNGNTLVINDSGLTWTNTTAGTNSVSVAFQRDQFNRITNIVDLAGHALGYQYDTNGNLVAFVDRVGQTNGFAYANTNFPHYLTSITDARGITPVQNRFDAEGRLIGNTDAFGNSVTYGHDIANNREYVTNQLGFVTASDYDDHGNVTHTIAPDGGETFTTYDENGNVLTVTDPLGRTTTYTYDDEDNRTSVTDPLGNTTHFTYAGLRRVTSVTDPRGNSITNTFDDQGNLLSMRDPLGNTTTFTYDLHGQPRVMENALGQRMTFRYDDNGRLAAELDANGHETDYARDGSGNLLAQTTTRTAPGGLQTLTVQFQYDEQSRLTNSIFPDGSSARTIYNAIGKPATTIDQQGRQTSMEYDALGRVTRSVYPDGNSESSAYDVEGRRIASTNRVGQVTRYEYDTVGRLIHTIYSDGTGSTNYFNLAGQLVASTDARGFNTFYGYDAAGRSVAVTNALGQVSRSFYDASGNLTNSIDALGRSTTFVYDALNRRVQTVFADGTTQQTWFDALGRRTYEQDQAGKVTAFGYDTLGRMTAVTNALGYVTSYGYDELGQQISQTDANQHTTTFEYDSLGRRVKRTLPSNQVEICAYNVGGLLTNKTDFNGYATTYQYDPMNRLLARIPDSARGEPSVFYAYNALGLRTGMTDASGSTAYVYDGRNRLAQKTKTFSGTSYTSSLNYAYDVAGNLTGIQSSDANGVNVAYGYDELGRLSAVNDAATGVTGYRYDDAGNLQGCTYPNLVHAEYQYDPLNRLTNLASSQLDASIANYAYTVGAAGNRLTAAEKLFASVLNATGKTINRTYTYDDIYRLTGENLSVNGTPNVGAASYGYDPAGNRLARSGSLLSPQTFSFDANDRLNTDTYDANGNTLIGAGFGLTSPDRYDFENRLMERNSGTNHITLKYDGDGNRVSKTVNGVTTLYVVDELNPSGYAQVLEELTLTGNSSPVLSKVYVYGHNLISQAQLASNTQLPASISYYGYDGHNNVRCLTDVNGTVTDTYDYDACGNLIAATGSTENLYLFTGEQYDLDLGLYYLRARYHNTDTGRFWTQDSYEGNGSDPAS